MLSAITFSKKITKIKTRTKTEAGLKLKVDSKTGAKLEIKVELGLLKSLSTILELANLDYIYFNEEKPNAKFLEEFFLFDTILLA